MNRQTVTVECPECGGLHRVSRDEDGLPEIECDRGVECPQCGSDNLRIDPYEDRDDEAGYRDCGVRVTCLDCGAVSTEKEMEAVNG